METKEEKTKRGNIPSVIEFGSVDAEMAHQGSYGWLTELDVPSNAPCSASTLMLGLLLPLLVGAANAHMHALFDEIAL